MKTLTKMLLVALLVMGLTNVAMATTGEDSSTVTITFSEISVLAVSGDPAAFTISAPTTAGDLPADPTPDASTTMAWTSNTDYVDAQQTRKITGSLGVLFEGITLSATVVAPGGTSGVSAGILPFTTAATAYEFVTGIENCNVSAQTITFTPAVTGMVTPYTTTGQTVTWTLTEGA